MTFALCFSCGNTKFGAVCPCEKCGVASTGDAGLDIAFSDHHISSKTIGQFGDVIQSIQTMDEDPMVRFWVFMRFITEYHGDILSAQPPDDFADRVDAVYSKASFPTITVEPGITRPSESGPETTIAIPVALVDAYEEQYELFGGLASVEVKLLDGTIHRHVILAKTGAGRDLILGGDHPNLSASDIDGLRATRGCFLSFRRRPWVSATGVQ